MFSSQCFPIGGCGECQFGFHSSQRKNRRLMAVVQVVHLRIWAMSACRHARRWQVHFHASYSNSEYPTWVSWCSRVRNFHKLNSDFTIFHKLSQIIAGAAGLFVLQVTVSSLARTWMRTRGSWSDDLTRSVDTPTYSDSDSDILRCRMLVDAGSVLHWVVPWGQAMSSYVKLCQAGGCLQPWQHIATVVQ